MKRNYFIFAVAAIGLLATACKKDIPDMENTYPGSTNSNGALTTLISQYAPAPQQFIINASTGGIITGARGTIVYFGAYAFLDQNGLTVNGNITVELTEVFMKKEMIGTGAFTTAGGVPVKSGGEVKITAWQGTQELDLVLSCIAYVKIPAGSNPDADLDMFFAEEITADLDFEREENANVHVMEDTASWGLADFYYTFPKYTGWTGVHQYMPGASSLTPYSVSLPQPFNAGNTAVYISFNEYNSISSMYSFDVATNSFSSGGYYQLPVGFDVTFIAISEINGQFYYGQQQVTVGSTCAISVAPQPCTQTYVDQQLNAL